MTGSHVQYGDCGREDGVRHAPGGHESAQNPDVPESTIGTAILRIVGHELRTPLNSIIGFAEILASGRPLSDSERIEYARYIEAGGQELLQKVNALLELSRIEAGTFSLNFEVLDAFSLLHDCCRSTLSGDEMGMEVENRCDELAMRADRNALISILSRLLQNALKYSGEDGEISATVRRAKDGVLFEVRDDGCGMSTEFLSRAESPFHQEVMDNNRERDGAGIGLAIVRGLVDLHQGRFEIRSELNAGTTASVWLPTRMSAQETENSWALSA
ncbi:MAG: sensor histidine kinase [Hyphomicrobiales bacterium]